MNIKELIAYRKTYFYINKNSQSLEFLGHTLQPGKGQKIKREVLKSIQFTELDQIKFKLEKITDILKKRRYQQ